ncbi:MAG: hypothetical protein QM477_10430 [Planctomycetota bacterium]
MKSPLPTIIVPATLLGLLAWAVDGGAESQLEASSLSAPVMVDTDGDGMDDVLEDSFGTSSTTVDSDGDTLGDMEELLRGTDPLVFDDVSTLPPVLPTLRIHAYSSGPDLVLQISSLRQSSMNTLQLFRAVPNNFHRIRMSALAQLPSSHTTYSVTSSGVEMEIYRLKLPASAFLNQPTMAIAVKGLIDGLAYADQVRFTVYEGILMEWRGDSPGPTPLLGGGLFPTDPGGQVPDEARAGEVCIQSLTQVGSLGGGQVLYQVSDSYCGTMPSGICFSSCSAAVGDSVVGIDVIGLLAN